MPQGRIINRVLLEKNITYNDFLLQFGKVSHVRAKVKDYEKYVDKYKQISSNLGRALTGQELTNNCYGLPHAEWFAKYCPDNNVKTYNDFVIWCGFESNNPKMDKYNVDCKLIELEKLLGRPITKNDITLENVGFSMIVVNRLYGTLSKAKQELGLMKSVSSKPESFEFYREKLDYILESIKSQTNRNFISWHDIERGKYCEYTINHKTLVKAFNAEGIDIFSYIKSKGFMMNPSNFSNHYTFDDGERVVSTMEYDFSTHIRSLGYNYNFDYFRDVKYKTFTNEMSNMNCDYKIMVGDIPLYIEIAGIIYLCIDSDWHTHEFSSKNEMIYRNKMIRKEKLLQENNCHYLFLFGDDMHTDRYKIMLKETIDKIRMEVA